MDRSFHTHYPDTNHISPFPSLVTSKKGNNLKYKLWETKLEFPFSIKLNYSVKSYPFYMIDH